MHFTNRLQLAQSYSNASQSHCILKQHSLYGLPKIMFSNCQHSFSSKLAYHIYITLCTMYIHTHTWYQFLAFCPSPTNLQVLTVIGSVYFHQIENSFSLFFPQFFFLFPISFQSLQKSCFLFQQIQLFYYQRKMNAPNTLFLLKNYM